MKRKILSVMLIALFSFAFNTKAETVTITPSAAYILFYPTAGGDPYTLYSTGDVPTNYYTAVVQLSGSIAVHGHVERSYTTWVYDPWIAQYVQENRTDTAYPDTDPYSPTFGQCIFYSMAVGGDDFNNVFTIFF